MRFQGKITQWDDTRGFGFIAPLNGNPRVFFHISAFPPGNRRPVSGEFVNYSIGQDDRGRVCATDVTYVTRAAARTSGRSGGLIAGVIAGAFLLAVAALVLVGKLWWPVAIAYDVMSLGAYLAYKQDKQAAQSRAWRTNEWTLIGLGLAGGWPGGLFAQYRFRHKTSKLTFQIAFWLSVALNLTGLAWLIGI